MSEELLDPQENNDETDFDERVEEEVNIRLHVRELKKFYTNMVIYIAITVLCMIIWLSTGAGSFWPIWVMIGFSAASVLQAVRLGQLPMLEDYLTFLQPDWEQQQVKILREKTNEEKNNS
jgi:hypothetical protein